MHIAKQRAFPYYQLAGNQMHPRTQIMHLRSKYLRRWALMLPFTIIAATRIGHLIKYLFHFRVRQWSLSGWTPQMLGIGQPGHFTTTSFVGLRKTKAICLICLVREMIPQRGPRKGSKRGVTRIPRTRHE